jgi:hypothetical protein
MRVINAGCAKRNAQWMPLETILWTPILVNASFVKRVSASVPQMLSSFPGPVLAESDHVSHFSENAENSLKPALQAWVPPLLR